MDLSSSVLKNVHEMSFSKVFPMLSISNNMSSILGSIIILSVGNFELTGTMVKTGSK